MTFLNNSIVTKGSDQNIRCTHKHIDTVNTWHTKKHPQINSRSPFHRIVFVETLAGKTTKLEPCLGRGRRRHIRIVSAYAAICCRLSKQGNLN